VGRGNGICLPEDRDKSSDESREEGSVFFLGYSFRDEID